MGKKRTFEDIKSAIEKEGTTVLTDKNEYKNVTTKIKLLCPVCDVDYDMTPWNFINGHRCPKCAIKTKADKHRLTYSYVKQFIEDAGYELLSPEYKTNMNELLVKCPNPEHEPQKKKFAHFQRGARCKYCYAERSSKMKTFTYDFVKNYIESFGYELLSPDYTGTYQKLKMKCDKSHIFEMRLNNFKGGHQRCPQCMLNQTTSAPEREIHKYIEEHHPDVLMIPSDWSLMLSPRGYPLQLDVWMPEIKKAIEYGADFYHSNEYKKQCDAYKVQWCKDNGIELKVINHKDWVKNKDWDMIDNFITG